MWLEKDSRKDIWRQQTNSIAAITIRIPQSPIRNRRKSRISHENTPKRPDTPTAVRKSLHEPLNALWSILESNPQSQFRNPKSTKTITNRFRATNGNRDDPNYQPHQENRSKRLYSRYRRFRKPIPNPKSTFRNPQSAIHNPQPLAYLRPLPTSAPCLSPFRNQHS